MTRPIAYYVHHQGDGHRQRGLAIARQAPERFVLIGTGLAGRVEGLACLDLPDDRMADASGFDGADGAQARPDALHYAPLDHPGVRERVAAIAAWIARHEPGLMVVDVSVEIAMLARLAATPTVYVRQNGRRNDPAHLDAFRGATALLAPFHATLDGPDTPAGARDKTIYCPGLTAATPKRAVRDEVVLVVVGKGGGTGDGEWIAAAARACPAMLWRVIGAVSPGAEAPANLTLLGWTDDAAAEIAAAGVVLGGAGNGLVNAVIAAGRPFVCLPEPRPFQEQTTTAARLRAVGAAVVPDGRPKARDWPEIVAQARALDPAVMAGLHDPDGPARTAAWLIALADGSADARRRRAA